MRLVMRTKMTPQTASLAPLRLADWVTHEKSRRGGAAARLPQARASDRTPEWFDMDVELVLNSSADNTVSANEPAAIERLLGTDLNEFLKLEPD